MNYDEMGVFGRNPLSKCKINVLIRIWSIRFYPGKKWSKAWWHTCVSTRKTILPRATVLHTNWCNISDAHTVLLFLPRKNFNEFFDVYVTQSVFKRSAFFLTAQTWWWMKIVVLVELTFERVLPPQKKKEKSRRKISLMGRDLKCYWIFFSCCRVRINTVNILLYLWNVYSACFYYIEDAPIAFVFA